MCFKLQEYQLYAPPNRLMHPLFQTLSLARYDSGTPRASGVANGGGGGGGGASFAEVERLQSLARQKEGQAEVLQQRCERALVDVRRSFFHFVLYFLVCGRFSLVVCSLRPCALPLARSRKFSTFRLSQTTIFGVWSVKGVRATLRLVFRLLQDFAF